MSAQNIFIQKNNQPTNIFGASTASINPFNVNITNNAGKSNNTISNTNLNPMNKVNPSQPSQDFTRTPFRNICMFLVHATNQPQINMSKAQKYFKQLQTGKSDFQYSDNRRKKYEEKYQSLNNLGMSESDLQVSIAPKSKELDLIFKEIIKLMCEYAQCDPMIALEYLRRYAKQTKFVPKLLMQQQSSGRWGQQKLNYNFITAQLIKDINEIKVDKNSQFIQQTLFDMLSLFYEDMQHYYQCFSILLSLAKDNIKKERSPKEILKKYFMDKFVTNNSLIISIWSFFEKIISQFHTKVKDSQDKLEIVNRKLKIRVFLSLSKVFYQLIYKYYSNNYAFLDIIPFEKVLKLLDDGLVQNTVDPKQANNYSKILLNFALLLTPFNYIAQTPEDRGNISQGLSTQTKNIIIKTKSQQLKPFRMLAKQFHGQHAQRTKMLDWEKLCTNGKWQMIHPQWINWMTIFLDYNMTFILNRQEILECVIYSCKRIVANNEEIFWSQNTLFSKKIRQFIDEFQKQKQLKLVLPILTKALGNERKQYFNEVVQLIKNDSFRMMIDRMRSAVNNNENIDDQYENYQVNPIDLQQQIKFICRIITLNPNNIQQLEFFITGNRNIGFTILKLFLDLLQIMNDGEIQSIKCSRYIINAIDAIFIQGDLIRKVFLYLLGAYQFIQREKPAMLIKIINVVKGTPKQGYYGIQCKKLRQTLSKHLNTLVRLSQTISEYFPCRVNQDYAEQYEQLAHYIKNQELDLQYQWIDKDLPYSTNVWFYQLAFCLKNEQWNPIDYDTVRLLFRKLAIRAEDLQQYEALSYVIEILNKKDDLKDMFNILQPMICSQENSKSKKSKYNKIFRLDSYHFQTFLKQQTLEISQLPQSKYSDKLYVQKKLRKMQEKNKLEVIGKIAGVLDLFHTALQIQYDCFALNSLQANKFNYLIEKCALFTYILRALTEKSHIYHYKLIETFQKQKQNIKFSKQALQLFKIKESKETVSVNCEINIIHTICTYLNFQLMHQISITEHCNKPEKVGKTLPVPLYEVQDFELHFDNEIDFELYDNILNKPANLVYTRDNSIMNSVTNIIKDYFLLGYQQLFIDCVQNRNFFLKVSNLSRLQEQSYGKQLISNLILLLVNEKTSKVIKTNILQILSSFIQRNSFTTQLLKETQVILRFCVFAVENIQQQQLQLLQYITLYLCCFTRKNLDDYVGENSQTIINLLFQISKSLINGFNIYSVSKQKYKGANNYLNLVLQKSINNSTIFKNTLRMLLDTATILIPLGTADNFYQFFDIVIINTPLFLFQGFKSREEKLHRNQLVDKLNLSPAHVLSIKQTINGVWIQSNQLARHRFGRNYQYDTMVAYQRLLSINSSSYDIAKQKIQQIYRINTMLSNLHTFEYNVQSFCVCMLSVLGQSKLAYSFSSNVSDKLLPKILVKSTKKRRYEYPTSFRDYGVFGSNPQQIWSKLKKLLQNILDSLDCNHYEKYNRNCLYLIVKTIIEIRKDLISHTLDPMANSAQQRGFVKRILFQLSHFQLSLSVYFLVLQSLSNAIDISQDIASYTVIPQYILEYLNQMNYVLFQIIDIINNKQVMKTEDLYGNLPTICAIVLSIINQHLIGIPTNHPISEQFQKYTNQICSIILETLVTISYNNQKQYSQVFYPYVYNLIGSGIQLNCLQPKIIHKVLNLIVYENKGKKLSEYKQQIRIWQWNTLAKIQCYFSNSEIIANIFDFIALKPKHPQIDSCYEQMKNVLIYSKGKLNFTYLMQISSIFEFLIPIFSKDLWTNKYYNNSIEEMLSILLRANFMDGEIFCPPTNKFQIYLHEIKVKEFINQQDEECFNSENYEHFNTFKKSYIKLEQRLQRSYFEFLWEDTLLKGLRYYLLLIYSGLQNSVALRNFYSKVFTTTQRYTQMIWSDINNNLVKIINFLFQVLQWVRTPSILIKMINLQKAFIKDVDFGIQSFMINSLLESSDDLQQWADCFRQTCQIVFQVICQFINIWVENDWKSDLEWQNTLRKDLCKKAKQLYMRVDNISEINAKNQGLWILTKKKLDTVHQKVLQENKFY